jgi:hypothetical protein
MKPGFRHPLDKAPVPLPDFRTCLSLWQPWAWLVVHGYKDVENRTWPTGYRGTLWIHAAMKVDKEVYASIAKAFPDIPMPRLEDMPRRGLVGHVSLVKIVRDSKSVWAMPGFQHWTLEHATVTPFESMPGRQGLFHAGNARIVLPTPPQHPTGCACGQH